jgi:hypothetical protein
MQTYLNGDAPETAHYHKAAKTQMQETLKRLTATKQLKKAK